MEDFISHMGFCTSQATAIEGNGNAKEKKIPQAL